MKEEAADAKHNPSTACQVFLSLEIQLTNKKCSSHSTAGILQHFSFARFTIYSSNAICSFKTEKKSYHNGSEA